MYFVNIPLDDYLVDITCENCLEPTASVQCTQCGDSVCHTCQSNHVCDLRNHYVNEDEETERAIEDRNSYYAEMQTEMGVREWGSFSDSPESL